MPRAIGAVGSALPSHGRGHRFESGIAHFKQASSCLACDFHAVLTDPPRWPCVDGTGRCADTGSGIIRSASVSRDLSIHRHVRVDGCDVPPAGLLHLRPHRDPRHRAGHVRVPAGRRDPEDHPERRVLTLPWGEARGCRAPDPRLRRRPSPRRRGLPAGRSARRSLYDPVQGPGSHAVPGLLR